METKMWSLAILSETPKSKQVKREKSFTITNQGHKRDWYLFIIHDFMDIDGGLSVFTQVPLLLTQ